MKIRELKIMDLNFASCVIILINVCISNIKCNCIAEESINLKKTITNSIKMQVRTYPLSNISLEAYKTIIIMTTTLNPFNASYTGPTTTPFGFTRETLVTKEKNCNFVFHTGLLLNRTIIEDYGKLLSKINLTLNNGHSLKCACANSCKNSNCTYFEAIDTTSSCLRYQLQNKKIKELNEEEQGKNFIFNRSYISGLIN